jgi:hypothetical protein
MGRTAWHDAEETNSTKVLDVLWGWFKEELTTEKLSKKLILDKDDKQKKTGNWQKLCVKVISINMEVG